MGLVWRDFLVLASVPMARYGATPGTDLPTLAERTDRRRLEAFRLTYYQAIQCQIVRHRS
jgi:hypothetical protein